MRIWKFPLRIVDAQTVMIPVGAKLLTVQKQRDDVCLWVLCDPNAPVEARNIAIYGTGNPVPDEPGEYVATFQIYEGSLVFHVFGARAP